MQHKIINTGSYLLIVDDSEIKEGDLCLADIPDGDFYGVVKYNGAFAKHYYKKIIAHLPLNDLPILEGVDLLPPLEDFDNIISDIDFKGDTNSFISGYKKHAEKYKYTEEDLIKAIEFGYRQNSSNGVVIYEEEREFIQSLQQPKIPVMFKCEMNLYTASSIVYKPKTIINSQNLTQLVGEYVY
jgi:hypothetical protein